MRNVAETTVWWTQGYIRGCYKTFIEEEVIIFRELTVEWWIHSSSLVDSRLSWLSRLLCTWSEYKYIRGIFAKLTKHFSETKPMKRWILKWNFHINFVTINFVTINFVTISFVTISNIKNQTCTYQFYVITCDFAFFTDNYQTRKFRNCMMLLNCNL